MNNYSNRKTLYSKAPRKATRETLKNTAAQYLARFSSSRANFFRVMMRHVHRSARYHKTSIDEGEAIVEELTQNFVKLGFLDDMRFAEAKLSSYSRRGLSLRNIRAKLSRKGISAMVIDEVFNTKIQENSDRDLLAAIIFSKKRKLGPFRRPLQSHMKYTRDEMAKLARAGFGYRIAQKIVLAKNAEELEEMVESKFNDK